ncbi:MAG: heavy-metal-associated domain-containing protein [Polaribacter sp.]|nr:heavy-metal-associated domain-containing protein [Polaribacter sp.]MDG1451938.1 heavy-metal-associated domain-containing protein [Polaribacter sp.]
MTTEIKIENLKCGGCAATIKKGLLALNSVSEVIVDLEKSLVSVVSADENGRMIKEKLSKLGYPETGTKNTILHKASSFVSCAVGRIDS